MKFLLLGGTGQLGREVMKLAPATAHLIVLSREESDFNTPKTLLTALKHHSPDIIINCAAYTAVDLAEENRDQAFLVNSQGVEYLARFVNETESHFIHISTDYVFDGEAKAPYTPDKTPNPTSIYGKSKLAGEHRIAQICPNNSLIIRTSWLYSAFGKNFVKTILNHCQNNKPLKIVKDQIGSPCWAHGLAKVIWSAAQQKLTGLYHWSDRGATSWYEFALTIQSEAKKVGILTSSSQILPITSDEYPFIAPRPKYSVLDSSQLVKKLNMQQQSWHSQLCCMLKELTDE